MPETTVTSRELVDEWLKAMNAGPSSDDAALDDNGAAVITSEDGSQVALQWADNTLSFYNLLFEVPEERTADFFKAALMFNLHAGLVGSGTLAYDEAANALTYCAHVPMEILDQERFTSVVANVFAISDELRTQFLTLAGVAPAPEPAAAE